MTVQPRFGRNSTDDARMTLGRRAFLHNGTLVMTAAACASSSLAAVPTDPLKFGLITDLHYADKPAAGSRHYRETLGKLAEAGSAFEKHGPAFLVELGDLIDAADSVELEKRYLMTVDREFSAMCKDRHYVLGNHCVDTLKKEEFLGSVGQDKSYYSFNRSGIHFIVLDACFRCDDTPYGRKNSVWTDANVPPAELEWLAADLESSSGNVIAFAHQRLDVANNHGVKNAAEVRRILESSGRVLSVFQGHSHNNDLTELNGIQYCTMVAMVEGAGDENSGYSMISVDDAGTIRVEGFRKQANYFWTS